MRTGMLRTLVHLGSLRGRASRAEFTWVFLGLLTLSAVMLAVYIAPVANGVRIAIILLNWLLFYPLIAVCVRRLHDLGKTGWYLVLWPIPIVGIVLLAWFFARPTANTLASAET